MTVGRLSICRSRRRKSSPTTKPPISSTPSVGVALGHFANRLIPILGVLSSLFSGCDRPSIFVPGLSARGLCLSLADWAETCCFSGPHSASRYEFRPRGLSSMRPTIVASNAMRIPQQGAGQVL